MVFTNEGKSSRRVKVLVVATVVSVVLVFLTAFTKFIYAKDYYFFVEASCDPATELCFVRDCDDYCPPNELEFYKTFMIKAESFKYCTDNSCSALCGPAAMGDRCEEILCNTENDDECSV